MNSRMNGGCVWSRSSTQVNGRSARLEQASQPLISDWARRRVARETEMSVIM